MAQLRLPFSSYLDTITEEVDRVVAVAEEHLEAEVPSCPAWRVSDLVEHLADVYDFWIAQIVAGKPAARTARPAAAGSGLSRLDASAERLVRALDAAGSDAPCWNWTGAELDTGWVARRVALENAVHRYDVELAVGGGTPIEAELAAEGIEERLSAYLAARMVPDEAISLGGTLCLVASDLPTAYVVELARGRVRWRQGRAPAETAVVGTASQLFLFTWNRVRASQLALTGRRDVAEAWRTLPV